MADAGCRKGKEDFFFVPGLFRELIGSKPSNRLDTNGDGYLSLEACRASFSLAAIYSYTVEFFLAGLFNTALI